MSDATTQGTLLRRVAAWAWIGVVCSLTLELAARVDDRVTYGAPLFGPYNMDQLFQPTARGRRGVPHAGYVKWALNGAGFRGPEIRADAGQVRIVTFGASETFGIYESPDREFPRVLEHDLNSSPAHDRYEVINAGMPGMRVGSGITYLYDIGRQLHPKIVIIYPTPTHYVGVTHPYCGRPVPIPAQAGFSFPEIRILDKIKDRVKDLLPRAGMTMFRKIGIAWAAHNEYVLEHVQPQSLDALETDLHCALQATRDIGAVPILVTHANRFSRTPRADDDYWLTGWRLQYPELQQSGLLELEASANVRIRAVAQQEHVALVDAAAEMSGDTRNFADHAHFTDLGAAKMARLLATAVEKIDPETSAPTSH